MFQGQVDVFTKLRKESGSGQMKNVQQKIQTMCSIMNYLSKLQNHQMKLLNQQYVLYTRVYLQNRFTAAVE